MDKDEIKAKLVELYIAHGDRGFIHDIPWLKFAVLKDKGYIEWLTPITDSNDMNVYMTPKALQLLKEP